MVALWFTILAVGVALVGVVLARSADRLGNAFRLDRSITGFIFLAAATSLPELVVSSQLARSGALDMAVGSLQGSCLMNLLILAAIDLSQRSRGRMLSRKAAAHVLSALASILLAAVVGLSVLYPGWPALGRMHVGSLLLLVAYLLTVRLVFVDTAKSRAADVVESPEAAAELIEEADEASGSKRWSIIGYALATMGIFAMASPLATTSDSLAILLGLSGTFFGAVFLALVTSLPEIVTTYEATRIGADDMAIGNVLGSNAFNLLILVAVDLAASQPLFSSISPIHAIAALGVVVTTVIAAMGMLYRIERRVWYLEPDAAAVIVVAMGFYYLLFRG